MDGLRNMSMNARMCKYLWLILFLIKSIQLIQSAGNMVIGKSRINSKTFMDSINN